ncbi:hypothetical protein PBRA_008940 [Plasmodiophora brassicae]|uniref:RING-type domain-containing protein n=1 Tax=Plasmodiophora brassicae TaxID=37360 RepID=A0A0G4J4Y9_PLABS|nr:hypothetical protein PBRA_008940 [Plasmodiophora brassicae]
MPFNYVYPNQYMVGGIESDSFTSAPGPNYERSQRNHRWNYVEEFTITEDGGFWRDGLYIVEVYASCDTDEDTNPYDVTVYTAVNDSFALTILGISMALFLAVSGVVFMILAIYQHRRRAIRMARLQQLAALRHGTGARHVHRGATPEQVEAIPLKDFLSLSLDDEDCKCAICLCDYVMSDKLRQITCGHHFHKDCLGEWLQQHHV